MDEETKVDAVETNESETTETVDNTLQEEMKNFMSTIEGQIANLTQMIEKMNPVADEPAEETTEGDPVAEETPEDLEKDADELLRDI